MNPLSLLGIQHILSSLNPLIKEPYMVFMSMHTPKEAYIPTKDSIRGLHKLSHTSLLILAKSEQAKVANCKRCLSTPTILPKLHPRPITNIIQNMA